jgi:hypothetical protein
LATFDGVAVKRVGLHTRNCAKLDRTLVNYTMCNVLRIVAVWLLVGFVCEATTYYPLVKMFVLLLYNIFYFVVIPGSPMINNFILKSQFCYCNRDLLFSMVLPPVITFVDYDFDVGQVLVVLNFQFLYSSCYCTVAVVQNDKS